jgi:transcriptional regulator GlxA family with amidase domain
MADESSNLTVAILLYEEVDLLDAGGPYEVFLTASRLMRRDGSDRCIQVDALTLDGKPITAYGGLGLIPHASVDKVSQADVLIVPGTIDIDKVLQNQEIIQTIQAFSKNTSGVTASVCTGAFLLAKAGLLDQLPWTTHWEDIELLTESLGAKGARRNERWIDAGDVITSGGLACGIDMALHLVARFHNKSLAERTARQLDYPTNVLTDEPTTRQECL